MDGTGGSAAGAPRETRTALAEAIAAAVAAEGLTGAGAQARVADLLAGRAEPGTAGLRGLVTAYRDHAALPADEAAVRLAEMGEVFAPEDDA